MTRKSHSHAHGTDLGLGPSTDRSMALRGTDFRTQNNTHKKKATVKVKQLSELLATLGTWVKVHNFQNPEL